MKKHPTNSELMDPNSPYFKQDWWKICEILPPDPWAYIISDYRWGLDFLIYAQARVQDLDPVDVGHFPESTSPSIRLKEALSVALQLQEDVEGMISVKVANLEFSWKWGEYQKALAIIYGIVPWVEGQKGMVFSSKQKSNMKSFLLET